MSLLPDLVAPDFVNHSAAPGASAGPDGFLAFFTDILRAAVSDIEVEIHDQLARGRYGWSESELSVRILPLSARRDWFYAVPVLGNFSVLNSVQIVIR